jgi:hypothetical protein
MPMSTSLSFALLLHISAAQTESSPALYVVENVASNRGLVETGSLVRLSMDRENKLERETLLSRDRNFFSDWGGYRIALGRYIVTKYGGVIDIRAKRVIHDEQGGKLLGLDDGKAFYRVENAFRVNGVFSFDLKERKVATIQKGTHWDLLGSKSPDNTMSVETDTTFDGAIWLHRPGKSPQKLATGFHFTYSLLASPIWVGVPCLWLDGEHILTVQLNRKLVILTTLGTVKKSIEVNDAPAEVTSPPRLWRDQRGQVIYSCENKYFLIDVSNGVASPLETHSLGHGFEASVTTDEQQRCFVYHDGKAIGQWVLNPFRAETAPGRLAFAFVRPDKNANLGYPDGVAVWDEHVGDWRTIKMWVSDLIGWSK